MIILTNAARWLTRRGRRTPTSRTGLFVVFGLGWLALLGVLLLRPRIVVLGRGTLGSR